MNKLFIGAAMVLLSMGEARAIEFGVGYQRLSSGGDMGDAAQSHHIKFQGESGAVVIRNFSGSLGVELTLGKRKALGAVYRVPVLPRLSAELSAGLADVHFLAYSPATQQQIDAVAAFAGFGISYSLNKSLAINFSRKYTTETSASFNAAQVHWQERQLFAGIIYIF